MRIMGIITFAFAAAHAHREDQLFYRWAERWVEESSQEAVVRALGVLPTGAGKDQGCR
jgi:hypothetical protein